MHALHVYTKLMYIDEFCATYSTCTYTTSVKWYHTLFLYSCVCVFDVWCIYTCTCMSCVCVCMYMYVCVWCVCCSQCSDSGSARYNAERKAKTVQARIEANRTSQGVATSNSGLGIFSREPNRKNSVYIGNMNWVCPQAIN